MPLSGKKILIIGGTGSLGQALIRRYAKSNNLIIVSRDEAKHWTLRNRLEAESRVEFVVGDIRDQQRMLNILREYDPEIILLAAALKQVDTCEKTPYESVQTNILGISNVINSILSLENSCKNLETLLMVSTDKACAPTNVYGMSKAISERIVTSSQSKEKNIKFVGVRYGNVLESRGSIIPLFRYQAQVKSKFTVTHESMTRFIMTLDESIDLIEETILNAKSGEIWLPKLRSMKILHLAEIFCEIFGGQIEITGMRPGEKLHEELISESESIRIQDSGKYFKMSPSLSQSLNLGNYFSYSSKDFLMEKDKLSDYLKLLNMFSEDLSSFPGREIEEIALPKSSK